MADKFNLEGFSVNESNVCTAGGGFVGDVTGDVTGNVSGKLTNGVSDYTEDGAISLADRLATVLSTTETVELTLADSGDVVDGQELIIKCLGVSGGNITVTPASFADGTSIVFDAADKYARLIYYANGTTWFLIGTDATIT